MRSTIKSNKPGRRLPGSAVSVWEARTAGRVLEAGNKRIIARSKMFVQAARNILEAEGLSGLTIEALILKTGLSRRSFYERFKGKDDLYLALIEEAILWAVDEFTSGYTENPDSLSCLQRIVESLACGGGTAPAGYEESRDQFAKALSHEHQRLSQVRPQELKLALRPLLSLMAELISQGMAEGVLRRDDPERQAALIYNLVSITMYTEFLLEDDAASDAERRQKLVDDIWGFCLRAIVSE